MTAGDMIDYCLDCMGAGRQSNTRLTAKILAHLNIHYSALCGLQKNWGWLRMRVSLNITASTTYITLPTTTRAGVTVPYISRVQAVMLDSIGARLDKQDELLYQLETGTSLTLLGRGVPRTWCVTKGSDGLTDELLVMPLPAAADTLHVWGLRSFESLELIALTDKPVFGAEYHSYLPHMAMTTLGTADGFDREVARQAERRAERLYRAMMLNKSKMAPPIQTLRWPGFGNFPG